MVIYSRLHETRPMGHEEEDLTAGLMCPPEMPPLTQTPIAIPAKKNKGYVSDIKTDGNSSWL